MRTIPPMFPPRAIAGFLTALSLLISSPAPGADDGKPAWGFFEDGRLYRMDHSGVQWIDVKNGRSGFSLVHFSGGSVSEIPLTKLEWVDGELRARGERSFPRLTFQLETGDRYFKLTPVRLEGVPKGRDTSLKLRIAINKPIQAHSVGGPGRGNGGGDPLGAPSLKLETDNLVITAHWTYLGDPDAHDSIGALVLDIPEGL